MNTETNTSRINGIVVNSDSIPSLTNNIRKELAQLRLRLNNTSSLSPIAQDQQWTLLKTQRTDLTEIVLFLTHLFTDSFDQEADSLLLDLISGEDEPLPPLETEAFKILLLERMKELEAEVKVAVGLLDLFFKRLVEETQRKERLEQQQAKEKEFLHHFANQTVERRRVSLGRRMWRKITRRN